MEQTIKWVKGDRPEKEGWYLVRGKRRDYQGELCHRTNVGYFSFCEGFDNFMTIIEYHAEIIGPNGEKYE